MHRFVALMALVAALLLPLAAAAQATGAPEPAPAPAPGAGEARDDDVERVADVRVEGVRRVEPQVVLNAMTTRPGEPVDRKAIREDLRKIFALGYFSDVQIDATSSDRGTILTVIVQEKPAIHQVRIEGNDEISTDDLAEKIDVRAYQILDLAAVKRNTAKIAEQYVEKGFYLAEVTYRLVQRPDNEVDVVFVVNENAKVVVKEIRFLGNEKISADQLKAVMITQEGGFLSFLTGAGTYREELFQRDIQAAQGVYYDNGYINVRFGAPTVALTPDKQYIYITIPVEEGEQFSIGKVDFTGDILTTKEQLFDLTRVESGEIFSRTRLQQDIQGLTNLYQDDAYAYVNITPLTSVDPEKRIVDLTFDIEKGPKVRWERIEIVGNEKTRDKVIRRELRIHEGELFSGTRLNQSKSRVTALGFFEPDPRTGQVEITTRKGSRDDLIVGVVEVKEKPTGTFQVGAGFSSVENFIATAQVSQSNFFGWGQSASLSAQISSLRQLIQLQFVEPYFLDTNWTFAFDFYRTEADYGSFTREATGGDVTFGHPVPWLNNEDLRLFLTYILEDVSTSEGGSLVGDVRLANRLADGITSAGRLTLNWDTRNNRLFPSRGFTQSVSAEYAPTWLGTDERLELVRYTGVSRWYFQLPLKLVFKTQLTLGYVTAPGRPDDDIPISELYFLGGINSVRGYPLRTIAPTVEAGIDPNDPSAELLDFPVGGNRQLIMNNELEFPILESVGIRGVVFYDLGNAWSPTASIFENEYDEVEDLNLPLGLFHSAGFGFRWFSPIGPLRFEWGIPLTPRETDEGILFEFTIGNSF